MFLVYKGIYIQYISFIWHSYISVCSHSQVFVDYVLPFPTRTHWASLMTLAPIITTLLSVLLGRVPLFPCYLDGNTTSTIPYKYAARQKQAFEFGYANGQRPSQKHPSALGRLGRPASVLLKRYDKSKPGTYNG